MFLPMVIILLCAVAAHPYFDAWSMAHITLIFGLGGSIVIALIAAETLRLSARRARRAEVRCLEAELRLPEEAQAARLDPVGRHRVSDKHRAASPAPVVTLSSDHAAALGQRVAGAGPAADPAVALPPPPGPRNGVSLATSTLTTPVATAPPTQPATAGADHKLTELLAAERRRQLETALKEIRETKAGAFSDWWENPVIRTAVLPVAGFLLVQATEYVGKVFR
jgi:hypothetical protein